MSDLLEQVRRVAPLGVWNQKNTPGWVPWLQADRVPSTETHDFLTPEQVVERIENCKCDGEGYLSWWNAQKQAVVRLCDECSSLRALIEGKP